MSAAELQKVLENEAHIEISKWGEGSSRTFKDLFQELSSGMIKLEYAIDHHGHRALRRHVQIVTCAISTTINGEEFSLMQTSRTVVNSDPTASEIVTGEDMGKASSHRSREINLTTKILRGETSRDAMARGLADQLDISTNWQKAHVVVHSENVTSNFSDGKTFGVSYPGLKSVYTTTMFEIEFLDIASDPGIKLGLPDSREFITTSLGYRDASRDSTRRQLTWKWSPVYRKRGHGKKSTMHVLLTESTSVHWLQDAEGGQNDSRRSSVVKFAGDTQRDSVEYAAAADPAAAPPGK